MMCAGPTGYLIRDTRAQDDMMIRMKSNFRMVIVLTDIMESKSGERQRLRKATEWNLNIVFGNFENNVLL